jgi:uncharacterized delta-60 repeat protein
VLGLQADGKVLVGGTTSNYVGGAYCLNRTDASGIRDPSFTPAMLNGSVRAIVVLPDQRILVGGDFAGAYPFEGFTNAEALVRLRANGSLDPAFHAPSFASDDYYFSFRSVVRAVARQADGRILVGGTFRAIDGMPRTNLARLSPDGLLETAFFIPGAAPLIDGAIDALVEQADGKILIGGSFENVRGRPRPGLARLLSNGELDTAFVPDLIAGSGVKTVKLQPDGRILVGGGNVYPEFNQGPNFVVRLEPNGARDAAFHVTVDGAVRDLASLPGGDVLIAGAFSTVNDIPQPRVARLQGGFVTRFQMPNPQGTLFPLRMSARAGATYVLEASGDLREWRAVRTNTAVSEVIEFPAPAPAIPIDPTRQFYRARLWVP